MAAGIEGRHCREKKSREKEETEEEGGVERKDVSLCLPGLCNCRRGGGAKTLGVSEDSSVGVEEIQLGYERIRCIFNHGAGVPDVTVAPL